MSCLSFITSCGDGKQPNCPITSALRRLSYDHNMEYCMESLSNISGGEFTDEANKVSPQAL